MGRMMFRGGAVLALVVSLGAAGLAASRPVRAYSAEAGPSAGSAQFGERGFGRDIMASRQVPGVAGPNGCVRLCEQDTLPCDPPIYKHADGRCTVNY